MKNTMKLLEVTRSIALIALVAVIGFSMLTCTDENEGTVSVSGKAEEGEKLTASSSGTFFSGFTWSYCKEKEGTYIPIVGGGATSGQDNCEFTIPNMVNTIISLDGMYIKAGRISIRGTVYSDAVGPVVVKQGTIDASAITITGTTQVGKDLTASTSGDGFSGNYTWEYATTSDAAIWTKILSTDSAVSGSDGNTLSITKKMEGWYIRASRYKGLSKTNSSAIGPVTSATP